MLLPGYVIAQYEAQNVTTADEQSLLIKNANNVPE